jgi:hypothetical protein
MAAGHHPRLGRPIGGKGHELVDHVFTLMAFPYTHQQLAGGHQAQVGVAQARRRRGRRRDWHRITLAIDAVQALVALITGEQRPARWKVGPAAILVDSAPKTERGRRRLALDPITLAALKAQRQVQAEDRQAVGGRYRDHGYVFTWPDGRPLHPENIANWFEQHTRAAGLPRIRLHDVRHSYATAALKAGISAKVLSERLGHASVAFTLQTYGHVIPGMDKDAAATVADLILSSTQKGSGTVVPDPSANKTANNGPQSDAPTKEVKDERPAR